MKAHNEKSFEQIVRDMTEDRRTYVRERAEMFEQMGVAIPWGIIQQEAEKRIPPKVQDN